MKKRTKIDAKCLLIDRISAILEKIEIIIEVNDVKFRITSAQIG